MRAAEDSVTSVVDFVSDLVGAPSVDRLAKRCVEGVQNLVASSAISFDLVDPEAERGETVAAIGVSDYFLARYEQLGRRRDPVLRQALRSCAAVDNAALMSPSRWCSLPIYREVFHLHRLTNVLYAPVVVGDNVVATIDVGRGDRGGRFTAREIGIVQTLARAVATAYASLFERNRLAREREQLIAALNACDEAVVVTDSSDGRRHLNAAASQLVSRLADGTPALEDLLARTGEGKGGLIAELQVELTDGAAALLRSRSGQLESQPGVVVSVLNLESSGERLPSVIESGLSPREREVARLAVRGLRDTDIAERLIISPHTVKHHLKAIYRKLGIRSRVELANLAR